MTPQDEITAWPARELASRVRAGQVSAVEALDAHLARIEKHNPELNAVVSLDAELARRQAEAADAARHRGEDLGPLHGVPMTIKDAYDVAGLRTTVGTPILDRVPEQDSTVAARLRAAGAIIVGHTNVPPWLADYRSENPIFGRTANPWDTTRTAGGSSGGAAAALAAGMTPLEIGSDLAGSVRLPAHFCGVYGLKATEHRVPSTGFVTPPPGGVRPVRIMGGHGPMARDLDDLELALSIIAGPDGRDGDVPAVPIEARTRRSLNELRLAVAPALPGSNIQKALRYQTERVASAASDAGAVVEERLPDLDWPAMNELFVALLNTITGIFDPTAQLPDEQRGLAWYLTALDRRDFYVHTWERFFDDVDALILPPAQTAAFAHEETGYEAEGIQLIFANLAGLPGLAVPAGRDEDGLPVGIQIIGPRWSETRLLDIAHALEEAGILPGFQAPPGY
jgi:amidase